MKSTPASCSVMILLLLAAGCIEPYDPPVSDEDVRLLVVDGYLNVTDGETVVSLSRSIPVESERPISPETSAFVSVEDEAGNISVLTQTSPGNYSGVVADPDLAARYRIVIRTDDSHAYASDFISLFATPPIDSITAFPAADGLELRVNTHDTAGPARYFKWKYIETFEYDASFYSNFMVQDTEVVVRPLDQSVYTCWRTNPSTDIHVASTEHLTEAVISNYVLHFIPRGSIKISRKYSLLVRQQALSPEAYNYWLNVQKSTEQVGGLFDPLPSEVSGNIRSTTHPSEKVIGFFSGGTTHETRIFLSPQDFPTYTSSSFNPSCVLDTMALQDITGPYALRDVLFVDAVYSEFGADLVGYSTTLKECADCTTQGGTTEKPDFWK